MNFLKSILFSALNVNSYVFIFFFSRYNGFLHEENCSSASVLFEMFYQSIHGFWSFPIITETLIKFWSLTVCLREIYIVFVLGQNFVLTCCVSIYLIVFLVTMWTPCQPSNSGKKKMDVMLKIGTYCTEWDVK